MGVYVSTANVQARIPYRTIDGTTLPTDVQVEEWIGEAEAELDGHLAGIGLDTPLIAAKPIKIVKGWVCRYIAGLVKVAYASAGGDGGNEDGESEQEAWDERLTQISDNPGKFLSMLTIGSAPQSSLQIGSYEVDNNAAIEPEFRRGEIL